MSTNPLVSVFMRKALRLDESEEPVPRYSIAENRIGIPEDRLCFRTDLRLAPPIDHQIRPGNDGDEDTRSLRGRDYGEQGLRSRNGAKQSSASPGVRIWRAAG